jgi:hypothetical protein
LAQLATHHSGASDAPSLMVAIEADAARVLAEQLGDALRNRPNAKVLIQTTDIADAERWMAACLGQSPIVAIGPQSDASTQGLSRRAGRCVVFEPMPRAIPRWRDLLFPTWVKQEVERLPETALKSALPSEAFLIAPDQKPARMRVIVGGGATIFMAPTASAPHDWSAPPVDGVRLPEASAVDADLLVRPGPAATKLRRVLTRAAAKPANKGARTK